MGRVAAMFLFGGLVFALAGCGGGSDHAQATVTVTTTETTSTETTQTDLYGNTTDTTTTAEASPDAGLVPVDEESCATLRHVFNHVQDATTLGYWDYLNDAAAIDNFADHVQLPDEVADSVKTFRAAVDLLASAYEEAGVAPNDAPLPDQLDRINQLLPASADTRAFQTVSTWAENDC